MSNRVLPTTFFAKPPMRDKNFEIYYNRDTGLNSIDHHRHTYYEFYFLISGNVSYHIEDSIYELQPGDCMLMSPGQYHYAEIDIRDNSYERYVLWLTPEYLESLSSSCTNLLLSFQKIHFSGSHLCLPMEIRSLIANLLQKILIQSNSQEYGADLLINSYITEILIHITKVKLYQQPVYLENDIGGSDILLHILNYIAAHIHENISIKDISEELYISKSHLSREFSKYMGISIHQYITKRKLYFAKQDLLSGTPVEQICSLYSFGNYTSFLRSFKKEFGIAPKAYSKKLTEQR